MKYAIETLNLTKEYRGIRVVDNLCLNIPEGKIYGFLGKNGAGKTTTIRMLTGLIKPDHGEIKVLGKDAARERIHISGQMGSVVETPGFYENLTARENLEITAMMFGISKTNIDGALQRVELLETGRKKVKEFSLGMKQRLGIANALIHSPKILVLDEPTNGLDPAGIKDMRSFLRVLSEKEGLTVLISSHLLSEVQLIADYVGIIDRGRLMEETEIQKLKELRQSFLSIEVDNLEQAEAVIRRMKLRLEMDGNLIKVFCDKAFNPQVNKSLISQGIQVFSLSSVSPTLEEMFMSVTSEKSA